MTRERPAPCHPERRLFARGVCRACYQHAWKNGTHIDLPSMYVGREVFVAEYEMLRGQGCNRTEIARSLRMTPGAVRTAYRRAVRAGMLRPDSALATTSPRR